ncbi:MAG: PgdA/CDA1 family [Verrucomicrobia bacterium]|nr:MAG: PgdA/CDA1 family [Verrucomicrobiota bacterium]
MTLPAPHLRRAATQLASGTLVASSLLSACNGAPATALPLALSAAGIFLAPTLLKNCAWYGPVRKSFATPNREVWLTIDDGPEPQQTPYILDVLGHHRVKATFFAIGRKILQAPELARRIVSEGHSLQNHTFLHPERSFWAAGPGRAHRELERCSRAIFEATGATATQFRAPVGFANPFVHAAAAAQKLTFIGWSSTGCDGVAHHPESVLAKIMTSLRPGGIILCHDSQLRCMAPKSRATLLDSLLSRLKSEGYGCCFPINRNDSPIQARRTA